MVAEKEAVIQKAFREVERKESEDRRSRSRVKDGEEKSSSKERPKTIINLKEEANFYARDSRARDRSRSGSPRRTQVRMTHYGIGPLIPKLLGCKPCEQGCAPSFPGQQPVRKV